ncbi:HAD family hydrolase [Phenylobacterium sp.]|uniref:HAD family hydrolase n=1 Tax=Phenylobacterium sp. TaxID=1871053 RepID=UPI00289DB6E2|nr:HAD family hydrolase [Phenylobacterium sp.]
MICALLIDLDDTLYDERTYVLSGFRAVADELAQRHPRLDAAALAASMEAELDAHGRGRIFDAVLAQAGLPASPALIAELVGVYRDHRPTISLWPGVADTLAALARSYRLAIVTDGLALMQSRKVEALGVADLVDEVLLCWEHEAPKPSPACYLEALRRLSAFPAQAVVIGDNPGHDMAAAAAAGCRSVRVRTGKFSALGHGDFPPDAEAPSFAEIAPVLARLEPGDGA